jgi:hypothetical protein
MTQERFTTREWLTEVIHQVEEMPPNEYEKVRKDIIEQETGLLKKKLQKMLENHSKTLEDCTKIEADINSLFNQRENDPLFYTRAVLILYELKKEKESEYHKFVQEFSDYKKID